MICFSYNQSFSVIIFGTRLHVNFAGISMELFDLQNNFVAEIWEEMNL